MYRFNSYLRLMLVLTLLCGATERVLGADVFKWDAKNDRVTASFRNWSLEKTLTQIAVATGWDVNIPEEETGVTVSGTFNGLSQGKALKHMFGHLNYAVFSLPNAKKPRLKVFLPAPEKKDDDESKPSKPTTTAKKNPFNRSTKGVNYADVMKRFDKNGDGLISNAEREQARKALSSGSNRN